MKAKIEVPEIEQLTERLQRYDLYGIPPLPARYGHLTIKYDDIPELLCLEGSWREIYEQTAEMEKHDIMIQEGV